MTHQFKTQGGYSGSPIFVSFMEGSKQHYIIAIHSGISDRFSIPIGVSIKLTDNVMKRLISMEEKLRDNKVSSIKLNTIEFEKFLQKFESSRLERSKFAN